MAAPNLGMAALVASLQEHAAYFDVPTFLASLNGQRLSHQALQKAFQEALQEQTLQTIKARFAATKVCSGNKCTTRHAIDALNFSLELHFPSHWQNSFFCALNRLLQLFGSHQHHGPSKVLQLPVLVHIERCDS